jgi:putative transposase
MCRNYVPGGTFFFTLVTAGRRPVLCSEQVRLALRSALCEVRADHPFTIVAWVLLPDHLHCVWELPTGDTEYSARWSAIKRAATRRLGMGVVGGAPRRRRDGSLWQRRFWEHTVRDEGDLIRHVDYVHWNPVRHGLVTQASDWPYSTYHRYVRSGLYPPCWTGGLGEEIDIPLGE